MKNGILLLLVLTFSACSTTNAEKPVKFGRETALQAYLWQQRSGEYKALSYQAYNTARMIIKKELENKHNRKRAVVFDIDETVLDNSFSGAYEVKNNLPWKKENFDKWVFEAKAEAMAGAVSFIKFLQENRVEPIFISNRTVDQVDITLKNFKDVGINVKKENMLFMQENWGKEIRRQEVLKKYDIVMLIGDNLHDFNKAYSDVDSDTRIKLVHEMSKDFGEKYIILPNPLYGDWEKSLPKVEDKRDLLLIK
jgi:5'-nucleotidase (lipoprotein e(P4) family)